MKRGYIKPTADQTYEIMVGERGDGNFKKILKESRELQQQDNVEAACNMRFAAVQMLHELLGDDDEINLEWNHENSRAAIEVLNLSAIDHFLISDFEISSALLEMILDLDPEDHLEASNLLAFNYLAMSEYELFDEVINDISDKYASRTLLLLWSSYMRDGALPVGELHAFKNRFAPYYQEFVSNEHPITDEYLRDIEQIRPSQSSQARELWLQTEILWNTHSKFIEALKNS